MDGVILPFPEIPEIGTILSDRQAMRLAIGLGYRGLGFVSPNPAVGCVVLSSESRLIGFGYHQSFGGPHAEVNALDGLSDDALNGAQVFVTLEPCAHFGKTPPCAELLATKPISRLVYGLEDPNPQVAGKGLKRLEESGIKIEKYPGLGDELEALCEHFLVNQREKRPFVSLKVASSLDGMMALNTGESKWITGEESRTYSHFLRACHDAILVGQGTFSVDNPSLNIRHPRFPDKANKVVILDPTGGSIEDLPGSKLIQCHKKEDIIYVVTSGTQDQLRPQVEPYAQILGITHKREIGLDLNELLAKLWEQGVSSLLVEGGGETLGRFLNLNLAHRLYLFQAPVLFGAGNSLSWTEGLSIHRMDQKRTLCGINRQIFGKDQLITGRFSGYNGKRSGMDL